MNRCAIVLLALVMSACGGPSLTHETTCTSAATCAEAYTTDANAATARTSCAAIGGTPSTDPCPSAGALGVCEQDTSDAKVRTYIFPSAAVMTQAGAKTECDNGHGTFTPLP